MLIAVLATSFVASITASGPVSWTMATQAEFLRGQSIGVSVDEAGRILAGPAITVLSDAAAPQVWSLAAGTSDVWVAGTGGDGRVVRGRTGQIATLLDTEESNVYAVAIAPDGRVYAATGPDGKVYVIDPNGTSRVLLDPAEKYIWALALDPSGRLWVGAGTPAVLYRVNPDGTSKAIYKPSAAHVVSLALDSTGRVLAGTESPGRLYRVDAADRPTALLESGLAEVRAIAVAADGTIFAAALAGDGPAADNAIGSAVSLGASASSSSPTPPLPAAGGGVTPAAPTRKSVVFRLAPTGLPEPLWETGDVVYDVAVGDAGTIIVATGPDGHLFRIRPNGTEVLINGVDAKQVTRVVRSGERYLLASANPGRVLAMGSALASPGTFLSPTRDAKTSARWGSIRWESSGPVALYTRSGNTDKPDDSWTDWAGPYTAAAGTPIQSLAARYLQWKAVFTPGPASTQAALTSVTVGYLPANARPVITGITVQPPGVIFQKPFGDDGAIAGLDDAAARERRQAQGDGPQPTPAMGRRMFQKGLQTFSWRAEDSDSDRLTYALSYRREGEPEWREWKTGVLDPLIVWDTTTVPDGRYVLKVAASDAASNTADRALTSERESSVFDIDNTAPVITTQLVQNGTAARLIVTVRDAQTAIDRLEFSVNAGAFVTVLPVDGVADARQERYEIPLPAGTDAARVMVRATDVMQNVSSTPATPAAPVR